MFVAKIRQHRGKKLQVATAITCLFTAVFAAAQALPAATPPMGWNSWNHFASRVTDADVRAAADALVSTGMRDAGYVYVNVDDTWQGKRDAAGVLHPNDRFPDMKALADYVHAKGLKFGLYSSPGKQTCGHYEGSLGHEAQDAEIYAGWGLDFLKYDLCSLQDDMAKLTTARGGDPTEAYRMMVAAFKKMGDSLKTATAKTGRPVFYSLCQYGLGEPWKWGPSVGAQMWRTTDDISDDYGRMALIGLQQAGLEKYAGPGHWNDPDMLEVGNGKMSEEEYRLHMSLWVLLAAPLLSGNDLSKMTDADKRILMNREAIAIDQDALGKQAARVTQEGDLSVWVKPLSGGRTAVGLVNLGWSTRDISLELRSLGLGEEVNVRDVWEGKDLGRQHGVLGRKVPGHGATLVVVSR